MFTGLKKQLVLSDSLLEDIVPQDHDLVKLKKVKGICAVQIVTLTEELWFNNLIINEPHQRFMQCLK